MFTDGIRINDLHSYRDFDVYIKTRNIGLPEKKSIRQTVPFYNGYYDFSALNGAPAWNERIVAYTFDVMGTSPQITDKEVSRILDWLCNVHDADIYDDTMAFYHWHGSYDSCSLAWDDNGEHVELTVSFAVHPFKIADSPTEYRMTAGEYIINNMGMAVAPIVYSNAAAGIQIGTHVTAIPAGESVTLEVDLERGENAIIVSGDGEVILSFYEEVI